MVPQIWPKVHNQIMFSLILAQLVLVFILAIKKVRSIPSLLPCWMTLWARQCMAGVASTCLPTSGKPDIR